MEVLTQLKNYVMPHWPWFAAVMVIYTCGLVAKGIWTKEKAAKSKFFWWMRATLPAHPLVAGALIGIGVQWAPGVDKLGLVLLYYVSAGGCAAYVVNIIKYYLKSKGIKIPGDSQPPPKGLG